MSETHIAILGSGPTGLEAALAAAERGIPFTLYEARDRVAASVHRWGHVRLFSPWDLDVSPRMRRNLAAAGVEVPAGTDCPTGHELRQRVFEPLAALPRLAPHLELGQRVLEVGRDWLLKHEAIGDPARRKHSFRLLLRGADGGERIVHASTVLDCTGTYDHPNRLGDGGIAAPGERELEDRIERFLPDILRQPEPWAGATVLLVGAGYSAQTAARDLAVLAAEAPGTRILWAVRSPRPSWPVDPEDPLPERARLTREARELAEASDSPVELLPGVVVDALELTGSDRIRVLLRHGDGARGAVEVDRVLSLTGYIGDHHLYRQLQVHECWATSGPMKLAAALLGAGSDADCLAQTSHGADTLTNPEPGFFLLGSKSYGRNNTFLMRVGWAQVEEVFESLDAGARRGLPPRGR